LQIPNVATYIDDQSVTFPARNLDVYWADMERIEVLEGPQGTLFGGRAEAGVIRYITNKPKINVTEGDVQASYGVTAAGGDPNSSGIAVLNVPSTFTRMNTDPGNHYFGKAVGGKCPHGLPPGPTSGGCVPANSQSANNYSLAGTATNPVDYTGIRSRYLTDKPGRERARPVVSSVMSGELRGCFPVVGDCDQIGLPAPAGALEDGIAGVR
jgi:iron complex outermembrane recepter protein